MPFKTEPRVRETSITTGQGTYTLDGAPVGYQAFASLGANEFCPYFATDGTNWEEGIGKVLTGPARLERTHVLGSSNADAAVDWGVGTRTLRCGLISPLAVPRALSKDAAGTGTIVLTQDEQRRQVLEFTGVLTGNRTIEVDATPWLWVAFNNTTGAFSLTVKVAGQAGVVIPQGRRAVLYGDGVDVRLGAALAAGAGGSEFASGTATTWRQTAAPVGWTKSSAHDNKALRIVSGTVGSGGATAFTSVFGAGKRAGAHTLSTGSIPAHDHNYTRYNLKGDVNTGGATAGFWRDDATVATSSAGGGGSHDHTLSLDLHYVDVIEATKD